MLRGESSSGLCPDGRSKSKKDNPSPYGLAARSGKAMLLQYIGVRNAVGQASKYQKTIGKSLLWVR